MTIISYLKRYKVFHLFLLEIILSGFSVNAQEISIKGKDLLYLSDSKFRNFKPVESIEYAHEVMKFAYKNNSSELKAKSYYRIARSLSILEMHKGSLYFFNKALQERYIRTDSILEIKIREKLATTYLSTGWKDQYFVELRKANKILDQINSDQFLNDKILLKLRIALNFGKYYALTKQVDSLQIYLRSADNYISSLKYIQNSTENLDYVLLKSEYYNQINRPDSALVYLDMSLISENFHDNTFIQYSCLGDYYFKIENYYCAVYNYKKCIENVKSKKIQWSLYPGIYKKIEKTYVKLQDAKKANYYNQQYQLVLDSLFKLQNRNVGLIFNKFYDSSDKEEGEPSSDIYYYVIVILLLYTTYSFFTTKQHLKSLIVAKEKERLKFENRLNKAFDEVIALAKSNDSYFLKRFEEVYVEFYNTLMYVHPNLTISEQKFCAMIYLKFETKEIAKYTYIEPRSVQKKKSRLRKKMGLNSEENFYDYLNQLKNDSGDS